MEYVALPAEHKSRIVRERLSQLEFEHQRLEVALETPALGQTTPADEQRRKDLEAQITKLQKKLKQLEK